MRTFFGIILILFGAIVGLYIGGYVLVWGGIQGMYIGLTTGEFFMFVWGAIKAFFLSGIFGWIAFAFFTFAVTLMLEK